MEGHSHIGVRDLRADLATHLKRAEAGDRLIVTVDGRPIAQIGPLEPVGEPSLEDLVASGLVKRPKNMNQPQSAQLSQTPIDVSAHRIIQEIRGP
tara:strand:+ start:1232 stop:1516 length:285 start_codon:yes stop_codon:yes gene_type:complete